MSNFDGTVPVIEYSVREVTYVFLEIIVQVTLRRQIYYNEQLSATQRVHVYRTCCPHNETTIYHVVAELVIEEMRGDVRRQKIEQDPLVGVLQSVHFPLFLVRLDLPQEIETRRPLHLSSMQQHRQHEH